MRATKNDIAWNSLFDKHKILEQVSKDGFFEITSKQINEFREARLMTKFDHRSQLPKIFTEEELSILPISRGSYIISDFETFKDFETNEPQPDRIHFPNYLESIDHKNITSEAAALNCAFVARIIENFVQDQAIQPTVSGRMGSSSFDFTIKTRMSTLPISVDKSQIEIDGGYEGRNALSLIEAKNSISDDFLIRQIYYPFRLWVGKVKKEVKSIFLTYSNGIFHFREYAFEDINHYNSLFLKREKRYIIREKEIDWALIQKVRAEVKIVNEPEIPFPQADTFERIINLCELLYENDTLTSEEITTNYNFDRRQTDYYTNAGRYLGLIGKSQENDDMVYVLTDLAKRIFSMSMTERQIEFVKLILQHQVFNRVMELYIENGEPLNKGQIVAVMKRANLYNINTESTFRRRASTVWRWVHWIIKQVEQ